jgi:LacI family transcriptional regulator
MKATINDVAKQAGVSIKTVSRVMNNEASVKPTTKEKVLSAVKALNYRPNLAARNLAGNKSFTIAYVYDNPNAYYVIDMQNGILSACKKQGFELLIHPCNAHSDDIVDEIINMIKQSRIAGLVLTPPFSERPDFVAQIIALDVHVVRIVSGNKPPDTLSPCILINDFTAAKQITEHLIRLGHKDIAFIAGGKAHKSSTERQAGYQAALNEHNLPFNPQFIIEGDYSFDSGVQGAKTLLKLDKKPSAIFCCNDEIAAGALFAARLSKIEVPEQLAIAGFENSPFSRQTWPTLTTANQPTKEIAETATQLLIANIRKHQETMINQLFTPELIIRDSTQKSY